MMEARRLWSFFVTGAVFVIYPNVVFSQEFTLCRNKLWQYVPAAADWFSAVDNCASSNARLAVVTSRDDLPCILGVLPAHRPSGQRVWVGANDLHREGFYTWVTGQALLASNFSGLWRRWEPSDPFSSDDPEDCVYSYPDEGGQLGDRDCRFSHVYVCQRDFIATTAPTKPTTMPTTVPVETTTTSLPPSSTDTTTARAVMSTTTRMATEPETTELAATQPATTKPAATEPATIATTGPNTATVITTTYPPTAFPELPQTETPSTMSATTSAPVTTLSTLPTNTSIAPQSIPAGPLPTLTSTTTATTGLPATMPSTPTTASTTGPTTTGTTRASSTTDITHHRSSVSSSQMISSAPFQEPGTATTYQMTSELGEGDYTSDDDDVSIIVQAATTGSSLQATNDAELTEGPKQTMATLSRNSPTHQSLNSSVLTTRNHPAATSQAFVGSSDGVPVAVVIGLATATALLLLVVAAFTCRRRRPLIVQAISSSPAMTKQQNTLSRKPQSAFNNIGYNSLAIQPTRSPPHLKSANEYEDVLGQTLRRGQHFGSIYCNEYYDDGGEVGYDHLFKEPATTEAGIYQQLADNKYKHLPRDQIIVGDQLGAGQFGEVFAGVWTKTGVSKEHVAIKTLKQGSSKDSRVKFLQEAAIMGQFRHRNVVQLYGVVAQGEPVFLVLELMSKDLRGHLLSFLTPPANMATLFLGMAQDIASGMAYLGAKGFVHRDLAARNVMIDSQNVCKIGDFGLSRNLANEDYYFSRGGKVPVKWTAPEAITFHQYSTASDVWSYGVVLYEIYEFGRKPYAFWSNEKVFTEVQAGYRLPKPQHCPAKIYNLMMLCWLLEKNSRPTFLDILQHLEGLSEDCLPSEISCL